MYIDIDMIILVNIDIIMKVRILLSVINKYKNRCFYQNIFKEIKKKRFVYW